MGCGSSAEVVPPAKDNLEEDPEDGLFKDSDFPADISSICYSEEGRKKYEALKIVWKRPPELRESPCLMVEGVCSTDIVQGELGDCWFLSACAAVARESSIVTAVFREHAADPQACKNSSGILGLQFWRYGTWEPVTIDDRLPCILNEDGKTYKLLFARCGNPDEFWLPMIEKAYAKLHGSYEALEGGYTMDGMVDLTGGITEMISLSDSKDLTIEKEKLLFKQLFRAFENKSFMTCGRSMGHAEVKNGLPDGHAYTITNVAYVSSQGRPEPNRLIRIKNPWASAVEWTGDWSDTDENSWSKVSEAVKSRIGHHEVHDDGQFWMNFKDFANEFSFYTICSITPDLDDNLRPDDPSTTEVKMRFGSWVGDSAGGSANKERPLATNPQYLFTIAEPDDDDDKGDCTVVIGLMQMYRRKQHAIFLSIGFRVYRANAKNPYQWLCDADLEEELGGSGSYRRLREVTGKVDLKPGNYIVIPSTAYPGEENDFMLRFFSGKSIEIHEMEES